MCKERGAYRMKGFLKFMMSAFAVFTAVIGALVVVDRFANKNRLEGDYLECDSPDEV
mgnify:CR=1 FL=1